MEQLVNLLKEERRYYVIVDAKKIKEAYEQVYKSINRLCPVLIFKVKNGKLTLKAYPNISSVDIDITESNDDFSVYICPFEFKKVLSNTKNNSYLIINKFYPSNALIFETHNNKHLSIFVTKTIGSWKYPKFKVKKGEKLLEVNYLKDKKLFKIYTTEGRVCYIEFGDDDWLEKLIRKLKGYVDYMELSLKPPLADTWCDPYVDACSVDVRRNCDIFADYCEMFGRPFKVVFFVFYPEKEAYLKVTTWKDYGDYGKDYTYITYKWTGSRMFTKVE